MRSKNLVFCAFIFDQKLASRWLAGEKGLAPYPLDAPSTLTGGRMMRETLGAIAGAVLAYAACAFGFADLDPTAWGQNGRFMCVMIMFVLAYTGAFAAHLSRGR